MIEYARPLEYGCKVAHAPVPFTDGKKGKRELSLIEAYLIGLLVGIFQALPQLEPVWRNMLITGFLGALTTFSTFSAEVMGFMATQEYLKALFASSLHLLGSLILTFMGLKTAAMILQQ